MYLIRSEQPCAAGTRRVQALSGSIAPMRTSGLNIQAFTTGLESHMHHALRLESALMDDSPLSLQIRCPLRTLPLEPPNGNRQERQQPPGGTREYGPGP